MKNNNLVVGQTGGKWLLCGPKGKTGPVPPELNKLLFPNHFAPKPAPERLETNSQRARRIIAERKAGA